MSDPEALRLAGTADDLDSESPQVSRRGPEVIADFVRNLPERPGVYRMMNAAGDVLYVGKARSLKKRVQSYTRAQGQPTRIARMIAETAGMEFVTTATETEALLLEANLIKRLRPRYNVLLRDDKSFPYILVSRDHAVPKIEKHRGARNRKGDYFGPFASTWAVNRTIGALQRAFLLRSCSDPVFESRTRPCLLFQIKRCSGPCTQEISPPDYAELVDEATSFLSGKSQRVKHALAVEMESAAEAMDYERAARLRDRLAALASIQSHQGINPQGVEEADVFALHQSGGLACVQVFFFRTGQNWGNRAFFPRADKSMAADEVLGSFLAQFYEDRPSPRLVLISHEVEDRDLIEEALSLRAGRKVEVCVPKRGEKRGLVEHALTNAREAAARRLAESSSQMRLLEGLADAFGLEAPPRRVEVYDNSHIQGTNPVGVMVVAGPDGFLKGQYRKFNIRSADLAPGDDYGMMREVLHRRFARLIKEAGPREAAGEEPGGEEAENGAPPWPDLVMIDGGAGQLSAARDILAELGVEGLPLVAIAKGPDRDAGMERFFMPGRDPFRLPERDPVLYYVQRLRDEAHRFAIGTHRAKRSKAIGFSALDEIPGIGPSRKRALIRHFGTAKAASRAGLQDLEAVPGISAGMARAIYDFFHDQRD